MKIKVTFEKETIDRVSVLCKAADCYRCPFFTSTDKKCVLKDANHHEPWESWEYEDDRMEDDLK